MSTGSMFVAGVALLSLLLGSGGCGKGDSRQATPDVPDTSAKAASSTHVKPRGPAAQAEASAAKSAAVAPSEPSGRPLAKPEAIPPSSVAAKPAPTGNVPAASVASKAGAKAPSSAPASPEPSGAVSADPAPAASLAVPAAVGPGKYFSKKASGAPYSAWLQANGLFFVGKAASVQAVVIAKAGYKCNDAYPFKFKWGSGSAGLSYPSPIARSVSRGSSRTVVSVPFTPTSAGKKTISGTLYLSVCDEKSCVIKREKLSIGVEVQEP